MSIVISIFLSLLYFTPTKENIKQPQKKKTEEIYKAHYYWKNAGKEIDTRVSALYFKSHVYRLSTNITVSFILS